MALDLLQNNKITHRYRHDMESFFYVLCFFCAQFRPITSDNPKPYFAHLSDWESDDRTLISIKKRSFLLDQWIEPLREDTFDNVFDYSWGLSKAYAKLFIARRRNDDQKKQLALEEIRRVNEEADEAVSYEVFRDILKR
ncbi:hypothetical protein QCA50_012393 [Cerrena zonata]|uniref:Fungal-type protein kinase domain-containing protein n=1 Tax=Cerrena zonata TaxID=2478898 RepID=A0AAW0FUB7_9APHY